MKLIDRRDDSVATEHISCLQSKQTRKGETPFQIFEMGDTGEPPPGQGPGGEALDQVVQNNQTNANPVQQAVTPTEVGDSLEILAEANETRNILEIKLSKLMVENEGVMGKAKNILYKDISILIFDEIGSKPEDCVGVALSTARYDTKEVQVKPGVDPTHYISRGPITFKDHLVEVRLMTGSISRITFKNVLFNI